MWSKGRSLQAARWRGVCASGRVWWNKDFNRLWSAESVSQVGSQFSLLVLPLLAALTLDATPFQVGLLAAAGQLPSFCFALAIGPVVDRARKRPLLIVADLARAFALGTVWIVSIMGLLTVEYLYVVSFVCGTFAMLYGVAYQSYIPMLVSRAELVSANGKLEASASVAQVAGPGMGGVLVGMLTAPVAILFDAASHIVSAIVIATIRAPEPVPGQSGIGLRRALGDGMGFIRSSETVGVLAGSSVINNFFGMMYVSVFVLFLTRDLHLGPTSVGLVFAAGGVGAVIGATIASRVSNALGLGRAIVASQLGLGISGLLIPLALVVPVWDVWVVTIVEIVQFIMLVVYAVNAISLRQAITPRALQGRVNAAFRFCSFGMQPFGSLLGGLCGGLMGLAPTLVLAQLGIFSALILLGRSSLGAIKTLPPNVDLADEPGVAPA